jgi:hypothetical protein
VVKNVSKKKKLYDDAAIRVTRESIVYEIVTIYKWFKI